MERKLRQTDLAKLLKTSFEVICRIERGKRAPDVWQIGTIAALFGLPVEGLLRGVEGLWLDPRPGVAADQTSPLHGPPRPS